MASEKYQVYVAPAADRKLAAHMEFLARVSENAALRLYAAYEDTLNFLAESPQSCPIYAPKTPIDAELRSKMLGKRYRIVFEIVGNSVYVYDIQDCRQDMDKNLI